MSDLERQIAELSPAKRALLVRRRAQPAAPPPILPAKDRSNAPLSFAQQRLWLINTLDPSSYLYNVPRFLKLTGELNTAALQASLNEIVHRHEVLRTRFHAESGEPKATVLTSSDIPLHMADLALTSGRPMEELARELALDEYRRPFDLARGPLIRANLWRASEREHYLLLVMHHIVSDGWTGGILFDELGSLYRAYAAGLSSPLQQLPVQYGDYATWQRDWVGGILERELTYWRDKLAGAPPNLQLPTDFTPVVEPTSRGQLSSLLLSPSLSRQVVAFARAEGITLFPLFLTALKATLNRWTDQQDLVVGTISANRTATELEKLIGCFVNFLALYDSIEEHETGVTLLAKVKQTVLEGFAHQDCPFEKVVEAINPQRALNVNPLYNVALLLQNYPEFAFAGSGLEARFLPFDTKIAFLDLRFLVVETSGGIVLECESNADLFEPSTIELLLSAYRDVLQQILADPSMRIAELTLPFGLMQQAKARRLPRESIVVAASFTAEPLLEPLEFWMEQLGLAAKIKFAPYDQVFQQLLDFSSLLSANNGTNLILIRVEDLLSFEDGDDATKHPAVLSRIDELVDVLLMAVERASVPYIACSLPPSARVLANTHWTQVCERAEATLASRLGGVSGLTFATSSDLLSAYPVENYNDEYAWRVGHIPYNPELFAALAAMVARLMYRSRVEPREVIVLNCDHTIWSGRCEHGVANIHLDASALALQKFMARQQDAGRILCLCSQSSEADVTAAFESHPEMQLGWQHIAASRLGRPVNEGLRELADELGLGLDSFIYVDADSSNCDTVRTDSPGVLVAQLPSQQTENFLDNFWAFDLGQPAQSPPLRVGAQTLNNIASHLTSAAQMMQKIESGQRATLDRQTKYVAPQTPTEETIAEIWGRLLRVERPGVRDNFFAAGGHSLLAVQLLARIRHDLGVELALRSVFLAPTIAELALLIEPMQRGQAGGAPGQPLIARTHNHELPLSFAQQRLWFIDQLEPGNPLYNISQMYRLRGRLDHSALEAAINEVARRHETLRTSFHTVDGHPVQMVAEYLHIPLPLQTVSPSAPAVIEAELQRLAQATALQPFDLDAAPLIRAALLEIDSHNHALVIVLHHIVGDGWSGNLLATELVAIYDAFSRDRTSPLPELTIQYADFALWQRNWLQGETLDRQVSYWKNQLAGTPSLLELPTDRPRPAVQRHLGAVSTHLLPAVLLSKLKQLSQAEGVTLFMTLLAGFQLLLSRYSGQDDIVIGTPVAGRKFAEIEPLIGFFVNTLAIRSDLSGDPDFRTLLQRVKQTTLDGFAHQEIPFERLVEELRPQRSLSYNPVFQVLFGLQAAPKVNFNLTDLEIERTAVHQATSVFDLSWFAFDTPEGLQLRVEYDTDLFDPGTVDRMVTHFATLMDGIAAQPEANIATLCFLNAQEREQILVEFNQTAVDLPRTCIHDLVAARAELCPDAVAIIDGGRRISYRELNSRANKLAHYLIARGAGPDIPIGIYSERNAELVIGILAILKSGSPYVPLDPEYPRERLGYILEDAKPPVVLTQTAIQADLPAFSGRTICLDSDWSAIDLEPDTNPISGAKPENLAYILFTSGSTGRPKGVALEHRTPVTFIQWAHTVFTAAELAGVLFSTSVCFDVSMCEMFVTLAAGGKLIVAPNALYLPTLQARDEVTLINVVPSVMAELVRTAGFPASVRTINLAGEALPEALVRELYSSTSATRVVNLYGPTETSYATFTTIPRGGPVTVGKPLSNTQCYIVDKQLNLVPIGVPGELYIAGDGLARGYYGRPELTAERFVSNPFAKLPSSRMYRTGDTCRWLPDGNIQYLGRMDQQVKLRGFRIELGEIEATLDRHPSVRQTVCMVREDEPGLRILVAYIVLRDGFLAEPEELRGYARQSLPEFMTPTAIVILDTFPQTPNGKINRLELPAPERSHASEVEFVAPDTPTETMIAGIWAEVLKLNRVGVKENFFDLGGHSLLAAQVISRIRHSAAVDLPLRSLFEHPTIVELAQRVDRSGAADSAAPLAAIPRLSPSDDRPLSFAQQRMWFLDQLEPGQALFNIPCALRVDSAVDVNVLQRAVDALVERHETLRSNFTAKGGAPILTVAESLHVPVVLHDLSQDSRDQIELESMRIVDQEAKRPFDLADDPLLRVFVIRLSSDSHILLLNIHHIISDRWSISVLLRELSALYGAFNSGNTSPLQDLPVQYADFAAWQRSASESQDFVNQLKYWIADLKDTPPLLELPADRPRPRVASLRGDVATLSLPRELTRALHELSRSNGTTLFMTLLAGFGLLLSRHSGQDDLVIGMPIASRNWPEVEGLIGLFANTLPVRLKFSGNPSFRDLLQRTKDATLGAYAHQDIPFERMVEELHPDRSLSYDPLVQVYFILQNAPNEGLTLEGLELKHIETDSRTAKGDLYFSLAEGKEGLHGRLEYSTDLFDSATIERLLAHYQVLLEAAVQDSSAPALHLPLLRQQERHQLLVEWNETEAEYPRKLCLHQMFETQVARNPAAVACVFEDEELTYTELNARANQLAHALQARGVGPGHLVALSVERSLDMMVGLLGIQKSGAAYVPLDPSYPADRVRFTLEDAHVSVLITQEHLLHSLPVQSAPVICLDSDWPQIAIYPSANPQTGAQPDDLVYVIFTSGTTGRPKGVQVPHRAVVNLLNFMARELRMGSHDVFPALASFAFDMCIPELYLALVSGGRVVIGDRNLASNGEELASLLRRKGATIVHATPTTWQLLLEAGFTGTGLKRAIGAEPLPRDLYTRLLASGDPLYNFYGPTETTVWSAFHRFTSADETVVVGRPLDNTQLYILDRQLQPVPIGVLGEIHIAGDGIARGYLHRPDLTAEKFIPDPFSTRANATMYRTGDIGRFLLDGRVQFEGRVDHQVKVRGYRIELGEVESVLGSHEAVQDCIVVAREDVAGDKRLVAYVVPSAGSPFDSSRLRLWVGNKLPDYMVPVAWVEMSRLPLSPNGKIDRKQLPAPEYLRPELDTVFQQARTPVEEVIAAIWSEVLKLDRVGLQDDFFELGGHSLLATQVIARLRHAFQIELPLRALFEYTCIRDLAVQIEALQRGTRLTQAPPPILPADRSVPLPLSFAQQRLWFMDQLEPNNPLFNVPYIARLNGPLQTSDLERSLQEIVRRHDALRTRFEVFNDEPVQVVASELYVPMPVTDLTYLPESDRLEEARRLVIEEVKKPFNLKTGPLLRASLFRMADQDHALMINTHHIVSDRWSLSVLSQELASFYEAFIEGCPPNVPELSIQYADYAVWQRQFLSGNVLEEQLQYWKEHLAGAPAVLELPLDHPRPADQDFWGALCKRTFPSDLISELRSLSRKHSVTLFMTLLAGFQILLARFTRQDDIVIGTDLANRTQLETEQLIGFFVNLLPIRSRINAGLSFTQILENARESALGAYAHQDIPFDKLVEELRPERSLMHNPLVQVLFVMQNTPPAQSVFGGITVGPLGVSSSSRFDLVLFINDPDGTPFATWMYNPNLFDAATMDRMSKMYEVLLRRVSQFPAVDFDELCALLDDSEKLDREKMQNEFQEAGLRQLKQVKRRAAVQI